MTIAWPKIVVTQDIPDIFYSYEKYDLVYYVSLSIEPTSTAVISYSDANGSKVEVYKQVFTVHPAKIEDIGRILESFVKSGKREFTLHITSNTSGNFTKVFSVDYIVPVLKLKEELKEFSFSSALHLTFGMVGTRADYSAKFTLNHGAETILSETYVPDTNNEVTIHDLPSLIEPYLWEKLIAVFNIAISIQEAGTNNNMDSSTRSFTALYSRARVNMLAEDFIGRFFLSTLMGDKVTAPGRKEYVHFVTTEEDFVSGDEKNQIVIQVLADYIDADLKKSTQVFNWSIELSTTSLQKVTADISPDQFERKGLVLIGYTAIVGNRKQRYIMDNECLDTNPAIAFINSFGCLETLYFTGTNELEPSIKRNAAYMNGTYRNYHVEEERIFKADTGVIPESMLCLVDELARSTDTYLIEKGEIGSEITITDSETKRDNNLDTLFRASITYRIANRNQNILSPLLPAKTFDKTFDKTFR